MSYAGGIELFNSEWLCDIFVDIVSWISLGMIYINP